jgi:hypothetical protein
MTSMQKRMLTLVIAFLMAASLCSIQTQTSTAQTDSTIYILPDGTIFPTTAPLSQNGSIYKLTTNTNSTIVVEKNGITLDGQGFTIQENSQNASQRTAINLTCTDTTVKNFRIDGWRVGILGAYDNNKIMGNKFTDNFYDIAVYAKNYEITQNYLGYVRIQGSNIHVFENRFDTGKWESAFWISNSTHITIEANEFNFAEDSTSFISTDPRSSIAVFHNNFLSKLYPTLGQSYLLCVGGSIVDSWDNGFPSGGNYWLDYGSKYGNASIIDDSGIWNQSYAVTSGIGPVDRYPLVNPYGINILPMATPAPTVSPTDIPAPSVPELPVGIFLIVLIIGALVIVGLRKESTGKPMGTVYA